MELEQKYRICKKCGCSGGKFYARKRNGVVRVGGICLICHRETESIRNIRLYRNNPESYYRRSRIYKMKNRERLNTRERYLYRIKTSRRGLCPIV